MKIEHNLKYVDTQLEISFTYFAKKKNKICF